MADKRVRRGIAALCAAAGWYCVIWRFSAQTGTSSGGLSDRLLGWLMSSFVPAWSGADAAMQADAIGTLSFFLRKGAHMTCYFILASLLLAACVCFGVRKWKRTGLVLTSCAALAGLDEYHQTFVPGRCGAVSDVGIDLLGAAIGMTVWLLLERAATEKSRPAHFPRPVLAAGVLAAMGGALLPMALTGAAGLAVCRRLCAHFLEGWSTMTALEQAALITWLSPVVAQAAQLLFAIAGGAACGVCRRRFRDVSIPVTVVALFLWGCVGACLAGGFLLWGGCATFLGFLLTTAGTFCVELWRKTGKIRARKNSV